MAQFINSLSTPESNQNNPDTLNFSAEQQILYKTVSQIESKLGDINKTLAGMSQQQLQDARNNSNQSWRNAGSSIRRNRESNAGKSISDGIEDALKEALGLDDMKKSLKASIEVFAEGFGSSLETLQYDLGKDLFNTAISSLKGHDVFGPMLDGVESWVGNQVDNLKSEALSSFASSMGLDSGEFLSQVASKLSGGGATSTAANGLRAATAPAANFAEIAQGAGIAGQGMTKALMEAAKPFTKFLPGIGAALIGIELVSSAIGAVVDEIAGQVKKIGKSASELISGLGRAIKRDQALREKITQTGNERLANDLKAIVEYPYQVLADAAKAMEDAWDANLALINQTQGYNKAELQDLISEFSKRIKSEGLESIISSADLTSNLANVLKSGLSGAIAEEFAYQATKLNAAIPTQDFFSYASTYASLTANAIKNGESQTAAIEYANDQLKAFASDLLYAGRQLSGGITTGLQNASDLFEKSAQIAIASRTGDPSSIAGVLTSVAAITGSIAPDLANSIVDAVYNAAVGGNNSQIVALRSLAGINASNTEFLRSFATDPKKIFSTLFSNLASLQNMSANNYMEVAEGLSNVFGLDSSAFARVDFNYLAKAIDNMNLSNSALEENINLLASGESTLSAEQMKIRQINEYMINEGLSYVLDNEVARSIQEHMWDQQRDIEIMENTFSVDIVGSFHQLGTDVFNLLDTITDILIPVKGFGRLVNLVQTITESATVDDRIRQVLEEGKVGQGNAKMLHDLTTTHEQLKLTNSYLSMLQDSRSNSSLANGYTWGSIGKSTYASLGTSALGSQVTSVFTELGAGLESAINVERLQSSFNNMKSTMSNFFGTTYEDTLKDAIESKVTELASKVLITDVQIDTLAREYLNNPEKYGIGQSEYKSKLSENLAVFGDFNQEVSNRAFAVARQRAEEDLRKQARESVQATAEAAVRGLAEAGKFGYTGYEAWVSTANKFGISDIDSTYTELGLMAGDVRSYFEALEAQEAAKRSLQREQDEEIFWAESQRYLDLINTNIHDVFDKGDIMSIVWPGVDAWLSDIDSNGNSSGSGFRGEMNDWLHLLNDNLLIFNSDMNDRWASFHNDWTDYYIRHTTYNAHLGYELEGGGTTAYTAALEAFKKAEAESVEDQWNALTEALATNPVADLMDPTIQQTVMLAKILMGVQTIIQQNNTQGKLKLPDAISALATGMQVVDNSSATSVGPTVAH